MQTATHPLLLPQENWLSLHPSFTQLLDHPGMSVQFEVVAAAAIQP